MTENETHLVLQLSGEPHTDDQELDQLAKQLRRELLQLDVEAVEPLHDGAVPEGAKAIDAAAVGALVVKLAPTAIGLVVRVISGWLSRSRARGIKLEIDGDVIEVSGISSADQERLMSIWIARHGQ